MAANNEIGTLQPIKDIGKVCKEKGVLFHTDAVQAVGKVPIDVEADGHRSAEPVGPQDLWAEGRRRPCTSARRTRGCGWMPIIDGGGHERGMRSGTLAVPQIVGLGMACELARQELPTESEYGCSRLREKLREGITSQLPDVYLNGHPTERLPGNLNLSFAYVEGEGLMMGIKDVAVSSGSACTSASLEPSYVLKALGVGDELAHSQHPLRPGPIHDRGRGRFRRSTRWCRKSTGCGR